MLARMLPLAQTFSWFLLSIFIYYPSSLDYYASVKLHQLFMLFNLMPARLYINYKSTFFSVFYLDNALHASQQIVNIQKSNKLFFKFLESKCCIYAS